MFWIFSWENCFGFWNVVVLENWDLKSPDWLRPTQTMTRFVGLDPNVLSTVGLFSFHPIRLSRLQVRPKPNPTQPVDNPIPSIKLRFPSKKSYLIIYYIFYLIKILLFTFFVLEKRKEIIKNYLAQADLCICTSIIAKPYFA